MLATAEANRDIHHDRADLVLFSTILGGASGPSASIRRWPAPTPTTSEMPPRDLLRPVRPRLLTERLAIPPATVRRRIERLTQGPVKQARDGLLVDEDWLARPEAVATSVTTWSNMRRLLVALAT
ncbi:hypothetical protein AB5I41_15765 [Sphingomonas sp. MMS24-JH45]